MTGSFKTTDYSIKLINKVLRLKGGWTLIKFCLPAHLKMSKKEFIEKFSIAYKFVDTIKLQFIVSNR